jgi:hypothetical protein
VQFRCVGDLELDTRNGWIEIHKAMVNLRVHRELIMLPGKMAALGVSAPTQPGVIADYTLAAAHMWHVLPESGFHVLAVATRYCHPKGPFPGPALTPESVHSAHTGQGRSRVASPALP